jgi:hypothetical protein
MVQTAKMFQFTRHFPSKEVLFNSVFHRNCGWTAAIGWAGNLKIDDWRLKIDD